MFYVRGSQTFGIHVPPNQNLTPLRTPKSEMYLAQLPPIKKFYPGITHVGFFRVDFKNLRTPSELLIYH
jgi:hypothetical protein